MSDEVLSLFHDRPVDFLILSLILYCKPCLGPFSLMPRWTECIVDNIEKINHPTLP